MIIKKVNVYSLLDKFVNYLTLREDPSNSNTKLSPNSVLLYVNGVRYYLEYYDIEISINKFRKKVTLPKNLKVNKESLNAEDIRTILLACNNTRLKVFLLVLASSGLRATEALSLRVKDIDFNVSPTKIHILAEHTKTKQSRDIYISNEASKELSKFIESKDSNNLVFSLEDKQDIQTTHIYGTLSRHFLMFLKR